MTSTGEFLTKETEIIEGVEETPEVEGSCFGNSMVC